MSADPFHGLRMASAAVQRVNAGGIDGAVPQQVGKAQEILFHGVKNTGKQVPQRVGKDLARIHSRPPAQALHLPPDGEAIQRPPRGH